MSVLGSNKPAITASSLGDKSSEFVVARKNVYLFVLLLIQAFNGLDRIALGMVLQDIKVDLGLTDTQLGLLTGIAFAFFYSVMGVPIARWADRGNRVLIITLTTTLWSAFVSLCGLTANFVQLLILRMAVAVGEAGCVPPAQSLIADYFNRRERPRAVAIYMMGVPVSMLVGYFLAGWLKELWGWRATLIILGLPGLALAALAYFTLKEPRTATAGSSQNFPEPPPSESLLGVLSFLWSIKSFRHLLFAFAVYVFFGQGILQWQPTFFVRSYGLESAQLGLWLSVVYGVSGIVGTYLGGFLAVRYAPNNERRQLLIMAAGFAGFSVVSGLIYLSANAYQSFSYLAITMLAANMAMGPLFAVLQTIVPGRMRAVSLALILLFANLIGFGFGPLAVGMVSDLFQAHFGQESLRYALLIMCPGYLLVSLQMWQASRYVMSEIVIERSPA